MALSKCKECGSSVSTLAKSCPKCGAPDPTTKEISSKKKAETKSDNSIIKVLATLGLLIVIFLILKGGFGVGKVSFNKIFKTNNDSTKLTKKKLTPIVNLSCRWISAYTQVNGNRMAVPSGMSGTNDITIALIPERKQIDKFEEFDGSLANIIIFNKDEVFWKTDIGGAIWEYRLSRMSGSLKASYYKKSNGGYIFTDYQCSKANQKF